MRPHRLQLLRKRLRRRILRLRRSSICVSVVGDALTVRAFAGAAWRHCRIRRARTWRRSLAGVQWTALSCSCSRSMGVLPPSRVAPRVVGRGTIVAAICARRNQQVFRSVNLPNWDGAK